MAFHRASLLPLLLLWLAHPAPAQEASARFSHKAHAPLQMPCAKCHPVSAKGTAAGIPGQVECKVCHTAFSAAQTAFPTKRVYRLPDFVFFSHRIHLEAKADCARCHGNVAAADAVTLAVPPTMKMCVDCHKEAKASIDCFICHEIGQ